MSYNNSCRSLPSPEDGNRPSFRNVGFSSYLEFRTMGKIHKHSYSDRLFVTHIHLTFVLHCFGFRNQAMPNVAWVFNVSAKLADTTYTVNDFGRGLLALIYSSSYLYVTKCNLMFARFNFVLGISVALCW
jgi:hypothetical protein